MPTGSPSGESDVREDGGDTGRPSGEDHEVREAMEAVPLTEDDPDLQFLIKIILMTTGLDTEST